jgi:hypothetical protein
MYQLAKVMKRYPRLASNLSAAFVMPREPAMRRSSKAVPEARYFLAMVTT